MILIQKQLKVIKIKAKKQHFKIKINIWDYLNKDLIKVLKILIKIIKY